MKLCLRLIGPLILVLIFYFYVDFGALMQIILVLRWRFFFISLALVPPLVFLRSSRWRNILARNAIHYSRWQCFQIYFVEMVAITVAAAVGTFAKAVYLKRDGYGVMRPVLTIIVDKYYDYLLPLIFGVTSVFLLWLKLTSDIGLLLLVCVTCVAFIPARKASLLLLTRLIPVRLKKLLSNKGWSIEDHVLQVHDTLNFGIYLYSVAAFGLYFVCIYCLSEGLNLELRFFQVVLIMTVTSLITLIPISFLGIGTRDAGLLVVFKWFGYAPEQAVALSMALLLLRIAIVFMGSIFWFIDPPPFDELRELH